MPACPPEELLTRLGTDALGAETYAGLEDHIESCRACQAYLQRLVDQGPKPGANAAPRISPAATIPEIPDLAIERELGRGSMGVVYLARQKSLQRLVALKVLRVGPDSGTRDRGRWRREARAASRAPHPNAVQLFQIGEAGGWPYLVFEYVAGGTLKDRLQEPMPPADAASLVEAVARAGGHFHRAGVLHLDLKPSNILLAVEQDAGRERVTPKVADFGLARLRNEPGATTGSLVRPFGTPDYMAPEQAAADHGSLGPTCDIYALGAILYHALTGRPPFQAASVVETLDQVRGQEPVPPRRLNPCVPRDLDTICLKCLQKDPGRRYQSADALADDLRRWREGHPIAARPVPYLEQTWRWCRRRPAVAGLTAALILTLAASFVALVVLLKHAQAERAQAVTARRLAEENEKAAVATISELYVLLLNEVSDPISHRLLDERAIGAFRVLRDRIGTLKDHPKFHGKYLGYLGHLEWQLAQRLSSQGRMEEAKALLTESVALLEQNRKRRPTDTFLIRQHVNALFNLSNLMMAEGEVERVCDCLEKIEAEVRVFPTIPVRVSVFIDLSNTRRSYANQLAAKGDPERSRRLLEADLRLLNSLDSLNRNDPKIVTCEALTLADLGETGRAEELLQFSLEDRSQDIASRQQLGQALAKLTVDRFLLELDTASPSPGPLHASPGAWADALLKEVHGRCGRFGIDPAATPDAVWSIAPSAFHITVQQRRSGKLAEAHRTGERFRALADRLVALYRDRPASYMVLSEAFIHQAKAAWKADDNPAAKLLELQALDAARRAFELDPQSADARYLVEEREQRVAKRRHP